MGAAESGFEQLVVEIVRRHAPDMGEGAVSTRLSRGGRYLAVTVTIQARSRAQLDRIYQALTDHDSVIMAL
jgi:putative lipoic acid-binding regulatory protein